MPRKRSPETPLPDLQENCQEQATRSSPSAATAAAPLTWANGASGAYVIPSPIGDAEEQIRESTPEDLDEDL